jgi:hypothetical protein
MSKLATPSLLLVSLISNHQVKKEELRNNKQEKSLIAMQTDVSKIIFQLNFTN